MPYRSEVCAKSVDRLLASKGLKELGLTTLEMRRKRGDLTEAFKIIKGLEDVNSNFSIGN